MDKLAIFRRTKDCRRCNVLGLIANGAEIADCNWVSFSASDTHYVKFDAVTSSQTDRETNRPCHFDL